jgi:membrane fusion protein, multidrug efflux system
MPSETAVRERPASRTGTGILSTRHRILLAAGAIVLLFAGWEILTSIVAYTGDAYVRSDLVALSPQITGHIIAVHVQDNQQVHKGDLLVSVDPVPFQLTVDARKKALAAATAQAQADRDSVAAAEDVLAAAGAARDVAGVNQQRTARLATDAFASRQALDDADEALRRARADVEGAQAGVKRMQRLLAMHDAAIAEAQAELAIAQ